MGLTTSVAENMVRSAISDMVTVMNQVNESCSASGVQVQDYTICVPPGGNVNIHGDLNMSQYIFLQQSCLQSANLTTDIQTVISEEANQIAEAINTQLSLTGAAAIDTVNYTTDLSTDVMNIFNQSCSQSAFQSQGVSLCAAGTLNFYGVTNLTQVNKSSFDCVLNAMSNTTSYQNLSLHISQSAKAYIESFLAKLFALIVIIIVFIVIIFIVIISIGALGSSKSKTQPTTSTKPSALTSSITTPLITTV